jgi:putative ABC transport system permease protein
LQIPVTAVVSTYVGTAAYMDINALHALMQEDDVISGAYLRADPREIRTLYHTLKVTPAVASVTVKSSALNAFNETIAENILRMRLFNLIFASVIAFGVIFNSARIALAERAPELATMRVLGFTRAECSMVLLGELATLTLLSLPFGMALGHTLSGIVVSFIGGETVRIPLVVQPSTYGFAAIVVLIAAFISGMIVRRGVDRLDLIEVLKTKA